MSLTLGPINAATPTPLKPDGSLDVASAKRLCAHWQRIGLDGVLVLGTMGEGTLLPEDVRDAFVELAVNEAGGKVNIFVGTVDASLDRVRARAERYVAMGVDCLVLCCTPGKPLVDAMTDVKRLADESPIPCGYYENPFLVGHALVADELVDVLSHPNIMLCKDSSNNAQLARAINEPSRRPAGVQVWDGTEYRSAFSRLIGYDGMLHGGGTMVGRWMRTIWDNAERGNHDEANRLDADKAAYLAAAYNRCSRPLQNIIGQKYVMKCLGVFDHETSVTDQTLDDASRRRIAEAVDANRTWLQ